jgi:hypothetical protein
MMTVALRFAGTPRAAATDLGINFSDTFANSIPNIRLVFSCYLIKHDDDYMVWDTGFGMNAGPVAPKTSLVDLLGTVCGVSPSVHRSQIGYMGALVSPWSQRADRRGMEILLLRLRQMGTVHS